MCTQHINIPLSTDRATPNKLCHIGAQKRINSTSIQDWDGAVAVAGFVTLGVSNNPRSFSATFPYIPVYTKII